LRADRGVARLERGIGEVDRDDPEDRRAEIDLQRLAARGALHLHGAVDGRKPLGRLRSSSFRTKLLPRISFGVIAQVMW
jgi:hypothetical protein